MFSLKINENTHDFLERDINSMHLFSRICITEYAYYSIYSNFDIIAYYYAWQRSTGNRIDPIKINLVERDRKNLLTSKKTHTIDFTRPSL